MNDYDILSELNKILLEIRNIEERKDEYRKKCIKKFSNIIDDIDLAESLAHKFLYMQIAHIDKDRENKEISHKEILKELKEGNLRITQYGRAVIDIVSSSGNIFPHVISAINKKLAEKVEKEKHNLEKLKDNIFTNVLTLMSILIAIVVFIFQSIKIITVPKFFELCLWQQLFSVIVLYIPLVIIISILLIFLRYIFNKKNKTPGRNKNRGRGK